MKLSFLNAIIICEIKNVKAVKKLTKPNFDSEIVKR